MAYVERIPARAGATEDVTLAPEISARLRRRGITALWRHQAQAVEALRRRRNVAVATGTASGKSLVYQIAAFERFLADPRATALYLFPTKALAQDQLRQMRSFALTQVRAAVYDGDTPSSERPWVRRNANLVITNPDMLHFGILPAHDKWATFLRGLSVVAVDEMHTLRGVFGSHVAGVLRRLRRLAARYGADPVFVAASATIANPGALAERLTGLAFDEIADDGSPRGEKVFALWNPPVADSHSGARRAANAEAAEMLSALVEESVATIAFARSRKGAELVASGARDRLADRRGDLAGRIAAYRAGYLAEERRKIEHDLAGGRLLGVAATTALELGIDVGGLDACLLAGYPGTVAATWQRAGRAGRTQGRSLAVLIAQDDPLDQYLVSHPEAIFGRPVEAAVVDPANPSILDGHLGCAAYEMALSDDDERFFGPAVTAGISRLSGNGLLRSRGGRHRWAGTRSPAQDVDIRAAGRTVAIVEEDTGALLGTSDQSRAPFTLHVGAIYLHQGEQFEVRALDLDRSIALVRPVETDCYTQARDVTDIRILARERAGRAGRVESGFGVVEVTNQVVAYARKRVFTGEVLEVVPLDLPEQRLETRAFWYVAPDEVLAEAGVQPPAVPGAAHAAEHASIGLMPLLAMCDRWDVGGVSTAFHEDTGACTVFVYDGYPGGVGICERGFEALPTLLAATLEVIRACPCESGCPSCVQSPKCGNGNEPLDKDGAGGLLRTILAAGGPVARAARRAATAR